MKKYTIRWIIGLISIALLGLLCVQLYWVNNAIALKKELFRQSVNGAMTAVVSKLEKREVASAVAQTIYAMPEPEAEAPAEPPAVDIPFVTPQQPAKPASSTPMPPEPMVHTSPATRQQRSSAVVAAEPEPQNIARGTAYALSSRSPRARVPQSGTFFPDQDRERLNNIRESARENALRSETALRFVNLDSIRNTMRIIMDSAGHRQAFFIDTQAPQRLSVTYNRPVQVSSRQQFVPQQVSVRQQASSASSRQPAISVQSRTSGGTGVSPTRIRISDGTPAGTIQMTIPSDVYEQEMSWNFAVNNFEEQARQFELHAQHLQNAFAHVFSDAEIEDMEELFPPRPDQDVWVYVNPDTAQYRYQRVQPLQQRSARHTVATGTSVEDVATRQADRQTAQQQAAQQQAAREQADRQQHDMRAVRDRLVSIKDMASCVVMELATGSQPIEKRVSGHLLDSLLKVELAQRGITLPFQYAVLSGNNDFTLAKPAKYTSELQQSAFRTALYPNDIIAEPHFLSIHFPRQDEFVYESMWGVLATSLAFILLILCCFSFTVVTLFRQKKLSDMKTDFINNMTHEFKTPIATISLASEALRDPAVRGSDNRVMRFINAIYDENKRLGTQVERVLQAAVIDRGEVQLNVTPVDVHEVLEQALHTVALQVESRGGTIECRFGAENNVIEADRIHLANVIINLLDNANKYSPEQPFIRLTTRNEHNGIVISVEDNGIGMSRDAQKKIFEKFYRVSTGNLHDVKGFGLGLSYVKAMVEAHGGSISVRSELKHGSHFDLYFPYSAQEAVVS